MTLHQTIDDFSNALVIKQKSLRLLNLLDNLTVLLEERHFWQHEQPSFEQLSSQQPFAIDTLSFTQWLQFIFIVRFKQIIDNQQPLPSAISIAPMASEVLPGELALFKLLTQIDLLISE